MKGHTYWVKIHKGFELTVTDFENDDKIIFQGIICKSKKASNATLHKKAYQACPQMEAHMILR